MPKIEIITRHPKGAPKGPPLLFVHGAFTHAGIWDVNFLPYLAECGYTAHAISLRGHGGSEGHGLLPWTGLADYVADLVGTINALPTKPVLIGHSLGGMVVQRYLRTAKAPGAVLMASAPPYGMWDSTLGMAFRDPLLIHQLTMLMTFGPGVVDIGAVRRAMVSDRMSDSELLTYEPLFQSESQRVMVDMIAFDPFSWLPAPSLPVLVMGAGHDAFLSAGQVTATARAFGTSAVIFPEMAHCMMIEPDWRTAADLIAEFVEGLQG